jgi:hypothetical protein
MPSRRVSVGAFCGKKTVAPQSRLGNGGESGPHTRNTPPRWRPPSENCVASPLSITRTPRCSRSNTCAFSRGSLVMSALPLALTMGEPAALPPKSPQAAWLALATAARCSCSSRRGLVRERRGHWAGHRGHRIDDIAAAQTTSRDSPAGSALPLTRSLRSRRGRPDPARPVR